jgi:lysophospholipase L1-like esterase
MNKDDDNILLVCFGTLEQAPLAHHKEAYFGPRGSLPGIGNETEIVYDLKYKVEYNVYTFGEYLRKIIEICDRKGIDLYFISPPVRNTWENGKHKRTTSVIYSKWMEKVAKEYNVKYIDNNEIFSNYLDSIGEEKSQELFAAVMRNKNDKQHTSVLGAETFAKLVYKELNKII